MAVASWLVNGRQVAMRGFHPPKTASVTHWFKAATAQIDVAPDWRTVDMGRAIVDADSIIFEGGEGAEQWKLIIARKRFLK